jgi:hypothetical protein
VAGIRGAGVNFLIPVNIVSNFVAKPNLEFKGSDIQGALVEGLREPHPKGPRRRRACRLRAGCRDRLALGVVRCRGNTPAARGGETY